MSNTIQKNHWEKVYQTKTPDEVSWTQEKPQTSLDLINSCALGKEAKIIDIGGGDSTLVDFLLNEGYQNITVLDISAKALERAQKRLGSQAEKVTWIEADVTEFEPKETYDIWHDRAAFHFLTQQEHIRKYLQITKESVAGYMILGTFSINGPKKCSGLDIQQYDEPSITSLFKENFEKLSCFTEDHTTPFNTIQNFIFCRFRKL
ncbi:class I SAM-dependent methyltransferase [Chryseobacterium daecheongense]|uniref:Class I SAM-dependent methyltransferase n=1 Tax=Chryseobacterium daecheongense TaxID=192389 RepID=A0A3N0W6Y7_9FLAO|nr:class I SAM-dependent methyltransferase [Chryseobacterium daecheongense]ROI00802.1 class I SAM-dependent methyltransferase [Chryseobacterium daecheongense]TDX90274.1 methyltransferase family protein [Chryseobacterium daecheongense]UOU99839.1 class I SAM-dependent methyltransferase [Chryseobacterium daecheongense]